MYVMQAYLNFEIICYIFKRVSMYTVIQQNWNLNLYIIGKNRA